MRKISQTHGITTVILVALALAATLPGCNGAFWGNLIVLAITVGIFFGTVALGRSSSIGSRSADASTSTQSGRR